MRLDILHCRHNPFQFICACDIFFLRDLTADMIADEIDEQLIQLRLDRHVIAHRMGLILLENVPKKVP